MNKNGTISPPLERKQGSKDTDTFPSSQNDKVRETDSDVSFMAAQLFSVRMWVRPLRNAQAKISSCDVQSILQGIPTLL